MIQGSENPQTDPIPHRAPRVSYRMTDPAKVLEETGTLALFGFGASAPRHEDPRWVQIALEPFETPAPLELWQVEGEVSHGRDGAVRWSAGGGWLFAALELDEHDHGGPDATAALAYRQLHQFISSRAEHHVLRVWNYLEAINHGEGDDERYKQFCHGRVAGMGDFFIDGFPAATAIGHHSGTRRLQIYLLASDQPGTPVENPRQTSAWRYPRQYGRTPPSFARAMSLPARDALAISGTAAVVGHASAHADDLQRQLVETFTNLDALLQHAGMPSGLDTQSPLKAYVRYPNDAAQVRRFIHERLPGVPVLLLHGDICRGELLVEIDGWRYA
jgi:chorismate lyase/3-hydroxybenzoate synthase